MKQMGWLVFIGILTVMFTGCETIKGFGKDLENTGTAITNTVEKI